MSDKIKITEYEVLNSGVNSGVRVYLLDSLIHIVNENDDTEVSFPIEFYEGVVEAVTALSK